MLNTLHQFEPIVAKKTGQGKAKVLYRKPNETMCGVSGLREMRYSFYSNSTRSEK